MLLAVRFGVPIRRPMWHRPNRLRGGQSIKPDLRFLRVIQTAVACLYRQALEAGQRFPRFQSKGAC